MKIPNCLSCFQGPVWTARNFESKEVINPLVITKRPRKVVRKDNARKGLLGSVVAKVLRGRKRTIVGTKRAWKGGARTRDWPSHSGPRIIKSEKHCRKHIRSLPLELARVESDAILEERFQKELDTLKLLLDPPPFFRNESENFPCIIDRDFSTLDFRKMNTVAVSENGAEHSMQLSNLFERKCQVEKMKPKKLSPILERDDKIARYPARNSDEKVDEKKQHIFQGVDFFQNMQDTAQTLMTVGSIESIETVPSYVSTDFNSPVPRGMFLLIEIECYSTVISFLSSSFNDNTLAFQRSYKEI